MALMLSILETKYLLTAWLFKIDCLMTFYLYNSVDNILMTKFFNSVELSTNILFGSHQRVIDYYFCNFILSNK